ncbi:MAG: hypothetical protein DRJ56_02900 [Thermoprotei archaeon]|nr:MAG: hypothetical protein DRJ56_02900 [Thermoprotei archaeon]
MVDLSVEVAGLELKNPLIVASGTPTMTLEGMLKCIEAGAAGLVTKTATYARLHQLQPRPRFMVLRPEAALRGGYFSLYSVELMSPYEPERWAEHLRRVKGRAREAGVAVIASIAGRTLEEWAKLARLAEDSGADMIELNLSCPHVEESEGSAMGRAAAARLELVEEVVRAVKQEVAVPVAGKVTPHGVNPVEVALAMERGGADAVVATARFQGLVVDPDSMRPVLWGGFGGYGGPWMVPLSCGWVARIALSGLEVPIIGSGGISDHLDALRFMLVGARAFQVCTAIVVGGYGVIGRILGGLKRWLSERGLDSVRELVGRALSEIVPFERLDRETRYVAVVDPKRCTGCGACERSCFFGAARVVGGRAVVDVSLCDGCGLCASLCPTGAVRLVRAS